MTTDHHHNRRAQDKYMMWERHFSSIVLAVLLAMMFWVGNSLTANIDTTARTDVRLQNIEKDLNLLRNEMEARMGDRYPAAQARKDFGVVNGKIHDLEKWQDATEKRIDRLEIEHATFKGK